MEWQMLHISLADKDRNTSMRNKTSYVSTQIAKLKSKYARHM